MKKTKPDYGREYWYIENGKIKKTIYLKGHDDDFQRMRCGNYYLTKENAMKHLKEDKTE